MTAEERKFVVGESRHAHASKLRVGSGCWGHCMTYGCWGHCMTYVSLACVRGVQLMAHDQSGLTQVIFINPTSTAMDGSPLMSSSASFQPFKGRHTSRLQSMCRSRALTSHRPKNRALVPQLLAGDWWRGEGGSLRWRREGGSLRWRREGGSLRWRVLHPPST
jgi:hypothetical protein